MEKKEKKYNVYGYDSRLNIRYKEEDIDKLRSLAEKKGYKDYGKLIRKILSDYVDKNSPKK